MKKYLVMMLLAGLIGILIVVGSGIFLINTPVQTEKQESIFEVKPGALVQTAKRLEEQKLIRDSFQFRLLARFAGYSGKVRVGEYILSPDMTPLQILETICSGKSIQRSITIPEGSNIFEIAAEVEAAGIGRREDFIKLCFDKTLLRKGIEYEVENCEGYLFPETYTYTKYTTAETLMTLMLEMFQLKTKHLEFKSEAFGLTKHQLVTLASIVEKETGADTERALVSSVYHNRLLKNMRLQADPTTLYGKMISSRHFETNITREDLKTLNKYNTYAMTGLPIGPIANPGLASLEAALRPAQTEYLFFVSQNDGRHVFSIDFNSHNNAVQAFQKNASARRGKSWRDLKKNQAQPKSSRVH